MASPTAFQRVGCTALAGNVFAVGDAGVDSATASGMAAVLACGEVARLSHRSAWRALWGGW